MIEVCNCPINLVLEESYKITGLLLQFCNLSSAGFTEQDIIFSSSILSTHAVSVGENGRGFYPVFAFMSHSCTYNARHVIDETNSIRVYSQTQIREAGLCNIFILKGLYLYFVEPIQEYI